MFSPNQSKGEVSNKFKQNRGHSSLVVNTIIKDWLADFFSNNDDIVIFYNEILVPHQISCVLLF